MGIYRVTVVETTTTTRSTDIEADSTEDARHLAESEDWREWGEDDVTTDASITDISIDGISQEED